MVAEQNVLFAEILISRPKTQGIKSRLLYFGISSFGVEPYKVYFYSLTTKCADSVFCPSELNLKISSLVIALPLTRSEGGLMSLKKVAIIGLGYWGPNIVRNFAADPNWKIEFICDSDESKLEKLGRIYSISPTQRVNQSSLIFEKARELDLVVIATPPSTHFDIAMDAVSRGLNILLTKPFTTNQRDTELLLASAKEKEVQVFVDHTYLFSPPVQFIKKALRDQLLGDIQYINSSRVNLGIVQYDVGVIEDLMVHDLAILQFLFDENPLQVYSLKAIHNPARTVSTSIVSMVYPNNKIVSLFASWNSPVKLRNFIVSGSKKSLIWDDTNASEKIRIYDSKISVNTTSSDAYVSYTSGDILIPKLENYEALAFMINHITAALDGDLPAINGKDHIESVSKTLGRILEE